MDNITVGEPQFIEQRFLVCEQLDAKIKLMGSHLENLKMLLKRASFMVARYHFDKLTALENSYLYLRHDLSTCLMLKGFSLDQSLEITSPYHEYRINMEVKCLELRLMQFRSVLFGKNKMNPIL